MLYKVADHIFELNVNGPSAEWEELESHYSPFIVDQGEPLIKMHIETAPLDAEVAKRMEIVHKDHHSDPETVNLNVYRDSDGSYYFELIQPRETEPNASLMIDAEMRLAHIRISEDTASTRWGRIVSLTSCIQIAYMLATTPLSTILTHSSCILKDGRTYLFLGKSGTGKSTHSRLWLKNVEGSTLLNDDHPILRVTSRGEVIAYGSPWSGKTHCYRNLQAPVGAIVRIKRAPYDAIHRQSAIAAYASLITSFSGLTIDTTQADYRHHTIEQIVKNVPCYELECLPDDQAAIVCFGEVGAPAP